jgi:hypothetical protein
MHFMGIDQHGTVYHSLKHPRKDLLARLGRKHAAKIYCDTTNGSKHVGYVVAGNWITVYRVLPFYS